MSRPSKRTPKPSFIRLEPILEIIETCIYSGRVGREKPVSVLLIAEQESAKTEALKHFYGTSTLRYVSDITSKGLQAYKNDIMQGQVRHVVIMDLVRILSHGKGVSDRLIQTLSSLMEEGEGETSDAGGVISWGTNFPRIGCLMSVTPGFYKGKAGNWRKTGFLTRFLPIRFSYSNSTISKVHAAIRNGHRIPEPVKLPLPALSQDVIISNTHAIAISAMAELLGQKNKVYGFRYHRVLRCLAKARALKHGRPRVDDHDIACLSEWAKFFTEDEIVI